MAFGIWDCLLILSAVSYFPKHAGWLPVFVYLFFNGLNPIVGDIHSHTIVKSIPSVFHFGGKSRHTGYLFCNGNSLRIHFMNQFISQCQVTDGIAILMPIKIIPIITECLAQSVAVIEHRSDTIETESVKAILFQPVFAVWKQEMHYFVFTVVEAKWIPCRMFSASARIEILVRITCKVTQSFYLIFYGMRMNNVHNNGNTQFMSCIN